MLIGFVAGVIVVFAVLALDRAKLDDPVGAVSVHLVCGIWGTLAVGIFSVNPDHSFMTQLLGVAAYGAFCLPAAFVIFYGLKAIAGLRVSRKRNVSASMWASTAWKPMVASRSPIARNGVRCPTPATTGVGRSLHSRHKCRFSQQSIDSIKENSEK